METTCRVTHYTEFGDPIPITERHAAVTTGEDKFEAIVAATLPPFVGPLTNETELAQLNLIALTRDAGLGDCLMLMPVVYKLRRMFPQLWVHCYVVDWAHEVLQWAEGDDDQLSILPMSTYDEKRYAKTVNLSWYCEHQPPEVQTEHDRIAIFARAFGVELKPAEKRWSLSVPKEATGHTPLSRAPVVALGLESAAWHRAPTPGLAIRIGKALLKRGAHLILLGRNEPEAEVAGALCGNGQDCESIFGKPLTSVASLIESRIDCLVCGDTGLYHLAGVSGSPFIALFGAIPPKTRLAGYRDYAAFSAKDTLPCVPCLEAPEHHRCQPYAPCMDALPAEQIAEKAMAFAERRHRQRSGQSSR